MKIDGKKLADKLLNQLKKEVVRLKKKKIYPRLAVVQIGENESSESYIKQKVRSGKRIGIKVEVHLLSKRISFEKTIQLISSLNCNPQITGIIIQRPIPSQLSAGSLTGLIDLQKDVDGFLEKTPFEPPAAAAVTFILKKIYGQKRWKDKLKRKKILLIGRGETGGKPVCQLLRKYKIRFMNVHSKTESIEDFKKEADIIISCVGKRRILNSGNVKKGVILIGLGITKEGKKIYGDYEEKEIKNEASYYTTTPGGIGPLTVAFLMRNVVQTAKGFPVSEAKHRLLTVPSRHGAPSAYFR